MPSFFGEFHSIYWLKIEIIVQIYTWMCFSYGLNWILMFSINSIHYMKSHVYAYHRNEFLETGLNVFEKWNFYEYLYCFLIVFIFNCYLISFVLEYMLRLNINFVELLNLDWKFDGFAMKLECNIVWIRNRMIIMMLILHLSNNEWMDICRFVCLLIFNQNT